MTDRIELVQGDITELAIDAIVNAANRTLLGGGGVDGAIHMKAGFKLRDFCRTLKGCDFGEAKMSPGFDLPAKYVIHTVGPIYGRHEGSEAGLLRNAYYNSLKIAAENQFGAIAFPNISTGAYGYPLESAAEIAISTVKRFLEENDYPHKVIFVCFDNRNFSIYRQMLDLPV